VTLSPAGPRANETTVCRKCGASIVFLQSFNTRTRTRSRMPVNVVPTKRDYRGPNAGEVSYVHGQHQPHWATCPESDRFRSER